MKPHYHINMTQEVKKDLSMWLKFLKESTVYSRPFIDYATVLSADDLKLFTDASGVIGFGGIHNGKEFFAEKWDPRFLRDKNPSIKFQELFAATVAICLWARKYKNKRICIFVDNPSMKDMINHSTSGCKNCMVLIRTIVLECLTWNIRVFAKYVKSKQNYFADAFSRNQMDRFWALAEKHEFSFQNHHSIPETLWSVEKIWMN